MGTTNSNWLPFGSPSTSGTQITVEDAMNNPTKITRTIMELAVQNFWADKLLPSGGDVQGGAVLYERPNPEETDLYPSDAPGGLGEIAPGDEAPLVDFVRGVPMVARPREFGGQFKMTRKAILRNDVGQLKRNMQRLANLVRLSFEKLTIAELDAVIASTSRTMAIDDDWDALAALTLDQRTGDANPLVQGLEAMITVEEEERGHVLDSVLLNSGDAVVLAGYYGVGGGNGFEILKQVFAQAGIQNVLRTHRRPSGRALLFEQGGVGEVRWEEPIAEKEWEENNGTGTRHYQLTGSPAFIVADEYAMLELTGIRA